MFLKERKPQIKEENNKILMANILKMVSIEWKAVNDEQKDVYRQKAAEDKREKLAQLQAVSSKRTSDKTNTLSPEEEKASKGKKKKIKKESDCGVSNKDGTRDITNADDTGTTVISSTCE